MGGYNSLEPTGRANARPMTGSVAPVRVKKTRQNKTLEPVPIQSERKRLYQDGSARKEKRGKLAAFQSPKRPSDYQGYRRVAPDGAGIWMPVLIAAALIATAILLAALITTVGTRFVGIDSPSEDSVWLIDRLTGSVYKCQATEHGKALCNPEIATGSIGERPKH
jgi:hypothetical protein